MIYKTVHLLPFVEITLKSGFQDDLGCDALCVFIRVPSNTLRALAIKSTLHPKPQMDGFSADLTALLSAFDAATFTESLEGFHDCIWTLRAKLSEFSDVPELAVFNDLAASWCEVAERWDSCLTQDGDVISDSIIAGNQAEFNALWKLTSKPFTPDGPLRASESLYAFAGFLPTNDEHSANEMERLVSEFCKAHELRPTRPGYHGLLRKFTDVAPEFAITDNRKPDIRVLVPNGTVSPQTLESIRSASGGEVIFDASSRIEPDEMDELLDCDATECALPAGHGGLHTWRSPHGTTEPPE